jgi:glycosyltransferase involved in cell wall biosynthesis
MRTFTSLAEIGLSDVPIIVPAFNNPTYVSGMLAQLRNKGLRNIVVVDNGSTAENMSRCFELAGSVVQMGHNAGPHYFFENASEFNALPDVFCVTDPDLRLNPQLPDDFLTVLIALTEEFGIGKAGFSLDISDTDAMRQDDFRNSSRICKIWEWEQQFWNERVATTVSGDPIYRADIDTTFAVYNKKYFRFDSFNDALRVAGRFTCKHLPWYVDRGVTESEAAYYAATQRYSVYFSPIRAPIAEPEFAEPAFAEQWPEAKDNTPAAMVDAASAGRSLRDANARRPWRWLQDYVTRRNSGRRVAAPSDPAPEI